MSGHDIIVIGASAGGVEALVGLVKRLPLSLQAAIFIVLHVPAHSTSVLPNILSRSGQLEAIHPENGQKIVPNRIYIAPPDYHLLVKDGYIELTRGPRENSHRPAIDPLFRSAARSYGARVTGVILSGVLDDGTAGLMAVKLGGGVAVVQDPAEALFPGMPRSAIENVNIDRILPIAEMAPFLVRLVDESVPVNVPHIADIEEMALEVNAAEIDPTVMQPDKHPGVPSGFACPDCGGALWQLSSEFLRFRCRTGHAFSPETLLSQQSEALEEALWIALRALEERADLAQRLAKAARETNRSLVAKRYTQQEQDNHQQAAIIRQVLSQGEAIPSAEPTLSSPILTPTSTMCVVAIASSTGGLKALTQLFSALPSDFPATITVVQHLEPQRPSLMVNLLAKQTRLMVKEAKEGDVLQPGTIYLAPPNKHLLVSEDQTLNLSNSKLVHFVRPSADLLFESVAASFKERAIAVVLSGNGRDGATGLQAIKKMGGKTIAQDQATAEVFGMPSAAIDTGAVDQILPLEAIAPALIKLLSEEAR